MTSKAEDLKMVVFMSSADTDTGIAECFRRNGGNKGC
jgi:hypothetical protein